MTRLISSEKLLVLVLALFASQGCMASNQVHHQNSFYDYFEVAVGETVEVEDACQDLKLSISSFADRVIVSPNGSEFIIKLEEPVSPVGIVVGDFWQNGRCFAAIKSTSGLVNESFDLYRVEERGVGSVNQVLINPGFEDKKIIVSYRDAARWHHEVFCYSENKDQPYVCGKRSDFNDELQRFFTCDENESCSSPRIVHKDTEDGVDAVVSSRVTHILEQKESGGFYKSPAYLVQNDRIILLDFLEDASGLYFNVLFHGESKETTGWINSEDISIDSEGLQSHSVPSREELDGGLLK